MKWSLTNIAQDFIGIDHRKAKAKIMASKSIYSRRTAIRALLLILIVASIIIFTSGPDAVPTEAFILIIVVEILCTIFPPLPHEAPTGYFFRLQSRGPPLR